MGLGLRRHLAKSVACGGSSTLHVYGKLTFVTTNALDHPCIVVSCFVVGHALLTPVAPAMLGIPYDVMIRPLRANSCKERHGSVRR